MIAPEFREATLAVIDDEESIREGCRQVFEEGGYRTSVAASGEEGLSLVERIRPQVVFVDLKMPGMDGMNLIGRIHEMDPSIVLVVITGYGTVESAVEAMTRGASGYLCKPFDDDALLSSAQDALARHRRVKDALELERDREKTMNNFAAVVCHQIKSPIVASSQWIEVMKAGLAGPLTPRQLEILNRAGGRIDDLRTMADRWLKIAQMEEGAAAFEPEPVDLSEVVRKAWEIAAGEKEAERIAFEFQEGEAAGFVIADAGLLEELFANLFSNSIKYTPGKGKVTVSVGREDGATLVSVSDTGEGVPAAELPHIFEPLYRGARAEAGGKGGTGLGLAIVRKIADLHGATVSAKSVAGDGTTFTVRFPAIPTIPDRRRSEPKIEAQPQVIAQAAEYRGFLSPGEIAHTVSDIAKGKCALGLLQMILLGMLAGVYIGFGAQLATMVTHDLAPHTGAGFAKFIGGSVFSVGLMLVILAGAELFTGNNLILTGVLSGRCSTGSMLRNWAVVYFANFIGSLLIAGIMYYSGLWKTGGNAVGASAVKTALAKVNLPFSEAFFRGIGCNWLVCLAVWMAIAGKDAVSKILGIYFPIMAFVASGFEHCVANMYFIPMGILLKDNASIAGAAGVGAAADLTWAKMFTGNLLPVTFGNVVGGALFVGGVYYLAYLRKRVPGGK